MICNISIELLSFITVMMTKYSSQQLAA